MSIAFSQILILRLNPIESPLIPAVKSSLAPVSSFKALAFAKFIIQNIKAKISIKNNNCKKCFGLANIVCIKIITKNTMKVIYPPVVQDAKRHPKARPEDIRYNNFLVSMYSTIISGKHMHKYEDRKFWLPNELTATCGIIIYSKIPTIHTIDKDILKALTIVLDIFAYFLVTKNAKKYINMVTTPFVSTRTS